MSDRIKTPDEIAVEQADFIAKAVSPMYRVVIDKAFSAKASPRAAIRAKCLDCSGYYRDEITYCRVILCPLHAYRPYQTKKTASAAAGGSDGRAKA